MVSKYEAAVRKVTASPPGPPTEHSWPRNTTKSVETRKRDLVIRITDWTDDTDEPAYDVEVYVGGVYDWNLSQSFTRWGILGGDIFDKTGRPWKAEARRRAIEFAQKAIAEQVVRL